MIFCVVEKSWKSRSSQGAGCAGGVLVAGATVTKSRSRWRAALRVSEEEDLKSFVRRTLEVYQ